MMNRRGQARIIEAVLATFMAVAVILMVMSFTRPLKSVYLRETSELRRLAYNLLNDMASSGVYEKTVGQKLLNPSSKSWEDALRLIISTHLPQGLVFELKVYQVYFDGSSARLVRLDTGRIANADFSSIKLLEAESIDYSYVFTFEPNELRGTMIYLVFTIGFSG